MKKDHISEELVERTLNKFNQLSPIFSVLSDENRQLIITELGRHDRLNVKEISEIVPLSRPAISHHLKNLKNAGIINSKKEGTENYYFLTIKSTIEEMKLLVGLIEETCHLI